MPLASTSVAPFEVWAMVTGSAARAWVAAAADSAMATRPVRIIDFNIGLLLKQRVSASSETTARRFYSLAGALLSDIPARLPDSIAADSRRQGLRGRFTPRREPPSPAGGL